MESITGGSLNTHIETEEIARFREQAKQVKEGKLSRHSLVITEEVLSYLIQQKLYPEISKKDALEFSQTVLTYFGYYNITTDNCLRGRRTADKKDFTNETLKATRSLFDELYDVGILNVEYWEGNIVYFTKEGKSKPINAPSWSPPHQYKPWRINYWVLNLPKIVDIFTETEKQEELESELYDNLKDEAWQRTQ